MNQKLNIWTNKYSRDYSLLVPWGYDSHEHMLHFAMYFLECQLGQKLPPHEGSYI
jgi:hypothetical protein